MQTILSLALALSPLYATEHPSEPALTKHETDLLNDLTKILEVSSSEADRKDDGTAVIIERTIASEKPEPVR